MTITSMTTLLPVATELAVLAALAAPAVYGFARRPSGPDRVLSIPPKLWVRILVWVIVVLLLWGAGGRAWLGLTHDGFAARSALAAVAVKTGVAVVVWLHYTSATLVAGRDGVHWFSFFRPWKDVSSVAKTDTGVRFRVDGRPASTHAAVLDDSFWAVDRTRWRKLHTLLDQRGRPASGPLPSGTGEQGRTGRDRGVVRRPLPTASHRLGR